MNNLFIDSTFHLLIGLLDQDNNWLEFENHGETKSSKDLHFKIHELLERNSKKIENIKNIYFCNGPGSYTGIKFGQGLADIMSWNEFKVYPFYHYHLPRLAGKNGHWLSFAYKDEFFLIDFSNKDASEKLLNIAELTLWLEDNDTEVWGHENSLNINDKKINIHQTMDLLQNNPQKIFNQLVQENCQYPPKYFRSLEQDFKK